MGLVEVARRWADERPDHVALRWDDGELTYRGLYERACRLGQALAAAGVEKGERVSILDKNGPEHLELAFGAAFAGAVAGPVNFRLTESEVEAIVRDAESRVLIVSTEFLEIAERVATSIDGLRLVVIGEDGDRGYEAFLAAQEPTDPGHTPAPDDVAYQLYSSGTTGLPKGVELTQANLDASFTAYGEFAQFDEDSVNLAALPMFHIGGGGVALSGLWAGITNRLIRDIVPDPLLDVIENERVTHAALVPAVIQVLLSMPGVEERDLSAWRSCLYGASPISPRLLAQAVKTFGCDFSQGYGLTETTGISVLLPAEDHDPDGPHAHRLRAAGKPVNGMEVKVVTPDSLDEAAVDEIGEIWLRGPNVMKGYWKKPEETAEAIVDGWFRTGDAGRLDADGYLYIEDRVKDMIISGGENVYPFEVENVIAGHPAVADVAVIAVPSEKWGETPKAMIVTKPDASATEDEIIEFARTSLAKYKCPTSVDFIDELPRSPTGKVLKKDLRAPFWAGRDRLVS